jgi:hypothetical protein
MEFLPVNSHQLRPPLARLPNFGLGEVFIESAQQIFQARAVEIPLVAGFFFGRLRCASRVGG